MRYRKLGKTGFEVSELGYGAWGIGGKERIYIATKAPPKNQLSPARQGIGIEQVFPHDYIIHSTETSLRNLGVETSDVQQLQVWNPEWIASDDWPRAFEDLKKSGKVRACLLTRVA